MDIYVYTCDIYIYIYIYIYVHAHTCLALHNKHTLRNAVGETLLALHCMHAFSRIYRSIQSILRNSRPWSRLIMPQPDMYVYIYIYIYIRHRALVARSGVIEGPLLQSWWGGLIDFKEPDPLGLHDLA